MISRAHFCRHLAVALVATSILGISVSSARDWTSQAVLLVQTRDLDPAITKDPKKLQKLVKDEALRATSQITLGQAVTKLKLAEHWELDHEAAVNRLRKATKVRVRPKTALFEIQVRAESEFQSARQCRAITEAYLERKGEKHEAAREADLKALNAEIVAQEERLKEVFGEIQLLKAAKKPAEDLKPLLKRLEEEQALLAELHAKLAEQKAAQRIPKLAVSVVQQPQLPKK